MNMLKFFNANFHCGHVQPRRQRYPTFLVFSFRAKLGPR